VLAEDVQSVDGDHASIGRGDCTKDGASVHAVSEVKVLVETVQVLVAVYRCWRRL
jgi:hypothetical protein